LSVIPAEKGSCFFEEKNLSKYGKLTSFLKSNQSQGYKAKRSKILERHVIEN